MAGEQLIGRQRDTGYWAGQWAAFVGILLLCLGIMTAAVAIGARSGFDPLVVFAVVVIFVPTSCLTVVLCLRFLSILRSKTWLDRSYLTVQKTLSTTSVDLSTAEVWLVGLMPARPVRPLGNFRRPATPMLIATDRTTRETVRLSLFADNVPLPPPELNTLANVIMSGWRGAPAQAQAQATADGLRWLADPRIRPFL